MKLIAVTILLSLSAVTAGADPRLFLRVGAGAYSASDLTFRDADCSSVAPPALFGCVEGSDGRPLAARTAGPRSPSFELGAGLDYGSWRTELVYTHAFDFSLAGQSNFIGVDGEQPVHAEARSASLFLRAAWEPVATWSVRPFVTAGAGVARNSITAMVYSFPGIGAEAVTVVPGGRSTHFAWSAGTGVSVDIASGTQLELAAAWVDAGSVGTAEGEAVIVRPRGVFRIVVGETESSLDALAFSIGLRRRF